MLQEKVWIYEIKEERNERKEVLENKKIMRTNLEKKQNKTRQNRARVKERNEEWKEIESCYRLMKVYKKTKNLKKRKKKYNTEEMQKDSIKIILNKKRIAR